MAGVAEGWREVDPAELAALGGAEARRRYFADRPQLACPELVWRLAEESCR